MKELQTALKGFVKQNETLKIETKVSKLKIVYQGVTFTLLHWTIARRKGLHQLFFA